MVVEIEGYVTKVGNIKHYGDGYRRNEKFYLGVVDDDGKEWNAMVTAESDRRHEIRYNLMKGDRVRMTAQKVRNGNWLSVTEKREFEIVEATGKKAWDEAREKFYAAKDKWWDEHGDEFKAMRKKADEIHNSILVEGVKEKTGVKTTTHKITKIAEALNFLKSNGATEYGYVGRERRNDWNGDTFPSTGMCAAIRQVPNNQRRKIVELMVDSGLVEIDEKNRYVVTEAGNKFIDVFTEVNSKAFEEAEQYRSTIPKFDKRIRDFYNGPIKYYGDEE